MDKKREDNALPDRNTTEGDPIVDMSRFAAPFGDCTGAADNGIFPAALPVDIAPTVERALLFLEDGDWKKADEYCEKALDMAPKTAEAYLIKLMAEKRVASVDGLLGCVGLAENKNFQKALRFASPELAERLKMLNERSCEGVPHGSFFTKKRKTAAVMMLSFLTVGLVLFTMVWFTYICPKMQYAKELEVLKNVVIGDTVTFGKYREPVEWIVIEKDGSSVVLLSKYAVDMRKFTDGGITVEEWLSGHFFGKAFNSFETDIIDGSGTPLVDGEPALDAGMVFLLSASEVNLIIKNQNTKICFPAVYLSDGGSADNTPCGWWLRSDEQGALRAVTADGMTSYSDNDGVLGVRPVLRIVTVRDNDIND